MARNAVTDWDTNADNNTDIAGIGIQEGWAPSSVNNAFRAMMAQLAAMIGGGLSAAIDLFTPTATTKIVAPSSIAAATAYIPITYASSMTLDLTKGYNFLVNLTGNATLTLGTGSAAPPASRYGSSGVIEVRATGGFTLTCSGIKGVNTAPPTSTTYYLIGYAVDSTGAVVGSLLGPYPV